MSAEITLQRVERATVRTEYFAPESNGSGEFWVTYITATNDKGEQIVTRLFSLAPLTIEPEVE